MNLSQKIDSSLTTLSAAVKEFPRIFAACSFGKDSRVIIDLALTIKPDLEFIGIDTGFEFPETLSFAKMLTRSLKINFRWVGPTIEDRREIDRQYGDSFVLEGQYKCCAMKIPAVERLLPQYDAWITGLRRDETEFRRGTKLVERGKIVKVNPLAEWTSTDVWDYIKKKKLAYHPLYDAGFTSLGCQPCTTQGITQAGGGRQGQFERAGRLSGSGNAKRECGLHVSF